MKKLEKFYFDFLTTEERDMISLIIKEEDTFGEEVTEQFINFWIELRATRRIVCN